MFTTKNYEHLLGTSGFSEALLRNHFGLYEGYVKNTNGLVERLDALVKSGAYGTPEYNELKRRFGWEYNGMRLHELYFGNMKNGGAALDESHPLMAKISSRFGSYEDWMKDFKATGAIRGIGWAILAYDNDSHELFNIWVNEHDGGHLAGATPLLVMDVFEHAFVLDYGMKRADYIEAFWKAIDWSIVAERVSIIE